MVIKGKLHFWSETGTEGGYWAIQNEKYIKKVLKSEINPTGEEWDYEGLHILEDGEELIIFKPDNSVYWEGIIDLNTFDVFTEDANGLWIHNDQKNVMRDFWALPFFKEYKGELIFDK